LTVSDDDEKPDGNSSSTNKHVKSDLQLLPKIFDQEKLNQLNIPELLEQIKKVQTDSPSADGNTRKRITQVEIIKP